MRKRERHEKKRERERDACIYMYRNVRGREMEDEGSF